MISDEFTKGIVIVTTWTQRCFQRVGHSFTRQNVRLKERKNRLGERTRDEGKRQTLWASMPNKRFFDSCPLRIRTGRPNSSKANVPTDGIGVDWSWSRGGRRRNESISSKIKSVTMLTKRWLIQAERELETDMYISPRLQPLFVYIVYYLKYFGVLPLLIGRRGDVRSNGRSRLRTGEKRKFSFIDFDEKFFAHGRFSLVFSWTSLESIP